MVVFSRMLCHGFVYRTHGFDSSLLQIRDVLFVEIAPAHVLVGAAVASFARGHAVALSSEVCVEARLYWRSCWLLALDLFTWLVEVLRRVVCCAER